MPATPGPWIDRHWDGNQQITITAIAFRGPNVLALVRPPLTLTKAGTDEEAWECLANDVDEAGANARLIVASPDLLAACKKMQEAFAEGDDDSRPAWRQILSASVAIDAAVALAEGK